MVEIYIEKNNTRYKLDLFEDENIEVSLTQKDFKNFGASIADFTKDFTIPASLNNQNIFGFYEDALTEDFDFRYKHDAFIFIDNVFFKAGDIKLNHSIKTKLNASSYSVTFFSKEVYSIRNLSKYTLASLDYSAFAFEYTSTNIKNLVTNYGYTYQTFIPLITKSQNWFYNSDYATDTEVDNIADMPDTNARGINLSEIRPALSLASIFSLINSNTELPTFTGNLLSDAKLKNLYLWLSAGKDDYISDFNTANYTKINFDFDNLGSANPFDLITDTFENLHTLTHKFKFSISYTATGLFNWQIVDYDTKEVLVTKKTSTVTGTSDIILNLSAGQKVYIEISALSSLTISSNFTLSVKEWDGVSSFIEVSNVSKTTATNFTLYVEYGKLVPKMRLDEFVIGVLKLFNAVIIPKYNGDLEIIRFDDWMNSSTNTVDLTPYTDVENIKISSVDLYKNISFDFAKNASINNKTFESIFSREFGSLEATVDYDVESDYKISLPFSVLMPEQIVDLNKSDEDISHNIGRIYDLNEDGKITSYNNAPLIFYASDTTKTIGNQYGTFPLRVRNLDNTASSISSAPIINTSQIINGVTDFDYIHSILFSTDIDAYYKTSIYNSLYQINYNNYIESIYNLKSRFIEITCYLNAPTINSLKMNDTIILYNRRYKIENMNLNLTTKQAKLKLRSYLL